VLGGAEKACAQLETTLAKKILQEREGVSDLGDILTANSLKEKGGNLLLLTSVRGREAFGREIPVHVSSEWFSDMVLKLLLLGKA